MKITKIFKENLINLKRILILSGSPRKGGNSGLLCDQFMRGAAMDDSRSALTFAGTDDRSNIIS